MKSKNARDVLIKTCENGNIDDLSRVLNSAPPGKNFAHLLNDSHLARLIKQGCFDMATLLIEKGCRMRPDISSEAFNEAVLNMNEPVVHFFLKHRLADPYYGHLQSAACAPSESLVRLLIKAGKSSLRESNYYHFAKRSNNHEMMRALVAGGEIIPHDDDSCSTATQMLHEALLRQQGLDIRMVRYCSATTGSPESVSQLISLGANANYDRGAALFKAASRGHTKILSMLIDAGGDVCQRNTEGFSLLHYAIKMKSFKAAGVLASQDALIQSFCDEDILSLIVSGDVPTVSSIHDRHPSIFSKKMLTKGLIEVCGKSSFINMATWLIDQGSVISDHAIRLAAEKGLLDMVKTLLECGGDPSIAKSYGTTKVKSYAATRLEMAAIEDVMPTDTRAPLVKAKRL